MMVHVGLSGCLQLYLKAVVTNLYVSAKVGRMGGGDFRFRASAHIRNEILNPFLLLFNSPRIKGPVSLQRLAALIPRPRLHLIRFHGVLALNAALRSQIVPGEADPTMAPTDPGADRSPLPGFQLIPHNGATCGPDSNTMGRSNPPGTLTARRSDCEVRGLHPQGRL